MPLPPPLSDDLYHITIPRTALHLIHLRHDLRTLTSSPETAYSWLHFKNHWATKGGKILTTGWTEIRPIIEEIVDMIYRVDTVEKQINCIMAIWAIINTHGVNAQVVEDGRKGKRRRMKEVIAVTEGMLLIARCGKHSNLRRKPGFSDRC